MPKLFKAIACGVSLVATILLIPVLVGVAKDADAVGTAITPPPTVPINSFGYDGVQGEHQGRIERVVNTIPARLQPALKGVTFINGCHPWAAQELGNCAFGTFDPAGWDTDDTVGHEWANSIWISSDAVRSGKLPDVVLHETGHAFAHELFDDCYFPQNAHTPVKELLFQDFAHEHAPPAELLADAFVLAFGDHSENQHTYYLDHFNFEVSLDVIAKVRAAVWLCSL